MRIPPAIDSAMWEVVESGDQILMDEFAARYPEYKGELAKRVNMVRELKGSKPRAMAVAPVFKPKADIEIPREGLTWTTPNVLLAVAGAAVLTFGVVRVYDVLTPEPPAPMVMEQPHRPTPEIKLYEPPKTVESQNPDDANPPVTPTSSNGGDRSTSVPADPFQNPVTISTEDSTLAVVLQQIATQAGLVLQAAPGMPNNRIHANYSNTPALQVLEDLGRNFGFTAMKDGPRSALLIPARDRSSPAGLPSTGNQEPAATTGGKPMEGPVNSRDTGDPVLPPVGE